MAYVYDPRTGYYNEHYQEKPTGLQQAQAKKLNAESDAITGESQRTADLQGVSYKLSVAQAAKAQADAAAAARPKDDGATQAEIDAASKATSSTNAYKKGGPVVKAQSKFNYPNYSGDSSILAKRRG